MDEITETVLLQVCIHLVWNVSVQACNVAQLPLYAFRNSHDLVDSKTEIQ